MNLLQLRNWLKTQTLIPHADSVANDYINQAYLDLATAHEWPWLEVTHTFNMVDGTASYALPDDLNRLRAVIYTGQGAEAQPSRTTRESVLTRFGTEVGEADAPAEFYRQGSNLVFVPTPSNELQEVTLLYRQRPTILAVDADEPVFDDAFHVYLAQAAAALYFESEDSFDHAGYYHAKAAETFVRMAEFYDLQMPPEQPFIIGGGRFMPRRRPFAGWETDSGV